MEGTNKEIKEIVEKTRQVIKELYEDDMRLKQQSTTNDLSITEETHIVFEGVLNHFLKQLEGIKKRA